MVKVSSQYPGDRLTTGCCLAGCRCDPGQFTLEMKHRLASYSGDYVEHLAVSKADAGPGTETNANAPAKELF